MVTGLRGFDWSWSNCRINHRDAGFIYALTRVFFAMARDGLLPGYFAVTNPKTKTPIRIIMLCGLFMAIISSLVPISDLAELVNIGTLFAFSIVCGGVIILRYTKPDLKRNFKTPFMPYTPILGIICCSYLIIHLPWVTILRFIIWLIIGAFFYYFYGYKHSMIRKRAQKQS